MQKNQICPELKALVMVFKVVKQNMCGKMNEMWDGTTKTEMWRVDSGAE